MPREVVVRVWMMAACIAAGVSGAALWLAGERVMGSCGLATALLHGVWMIDVRRCARVQRRPIVIPQLRHRTDASEVRRG